MKKWVFLFVFVFLAKGVLGGISGVSPGSYEVDFYPSFSGEYVFDFVLSDKVDLYVKGDLSDYVKLSKYSISGGEVVAYLDLPEKLDNPGLNQISVCVKGINICGAIKVYAPYPEKYVELDLRAPSVNSGKAVDIFLGISNVGSEVTVSPKIEIYNKNGSLVEVLEGGIYNLESYDFVEYNFTFKTQGIPPGEYRAVAIVYADNEEIRSENPFSVGIFAIRILSYDNKFVDGEVSKYKVEVENLWNNDMEEVFAGLRLVDIDKQFDTNIVYLKKLSRETLIGSFDATDLNVGYYKAEIILYYDGSSLVVPFNLKVVKSDENDFYWFVGLILFALLLICFLVWFFILKKNK